MVADDITGALDSGVQLSKAGVDTVVLTDSSLLPSEQESQAVVIVEETRHITPERAKERIQYTAQMARDLGYPIIYKKVDSALRGNIGAELDGMLDVFPEETVYFAPAFPDANRVDVDGVHYIDGVPVACSPFGKDPFSAVKSSIVEEILCQNGLSHPVRRVPAGEGRIHTDCGTVLFFEAENNGELDRIGDFAADNGVRLLAGCAGFARVIPKMLETKTSSGIYMENIFSQIAVLSGSLNEKTFSQIEAAERAGFYVKWIPEDMIRGKMDVSGVTRFVKDAFRCASDASIIFSPRYRDTANVIDERERRETADNFGRLALAIWEATEGSPVIRMFVGGDTLMSSLRELGISRLKPSCELSPGVVLSNVGTDEWIITKSGGLGDDRVFINVREFCTGRSRR